MQVFVRRLEDQFGVFLHEVRQVEHVLVEFEDRQLHVLVELLAERVAQQEGRLAINADERGGTRQNVGREGGVGHVGDHDPAQFAAHLFARIEGQALAIGGELAGPDQRGGEVGARHGDGLAHGSLGDGLDPEVHREVHYRAHQRQPQDRRGNLPARHAGGLGHHDLGILVDAVQRPDSADEDRERGQKRHNLRRAEHHDIEIGQGRLPVFEDQVGPRQALRQQRHHHESAHDDHHRLQNLTEQMSLDFRHLWRGATLYLVKTGG